MKVMVMTEEESGRESSGTKRAGEAKEKGTAEAAARHAPTSASLCLLFPPPGTRLPQIDKGADAPTAPRSRFSAF